MSGWRPISTYPLDTDDWGDEVLVLMPPHTVPPADGGGRPHVIMPYVLVAHMEGVWLARNASDPVCWDELLDEPVCWQPIDHSTAQHGTGEGSDGY